MIDFTGGPNLPEKLREILRNGPYDARPYGGSVSALVRALLGWPPVKPGRPPKQWAARIAMRDDDSVPVFEISASGFPEAASALVGGFGWPARGISGPPGTLVFRHSVGHAPTDLGFRLEAEDGVRMEFVHRDAFEDFPRPAWTRDQIVRMSCVAVADCVLRLELADGKDATVCRGFRPSALFDGLRTGKVYADFDLRADRDGEVYGLVAFRISAANFPLLYENARRVTTSRIPAAVRPVDRRPR